jgi:hypothetical protein
VTTGQGSVLRRVGGGACGLAGAVAAMALATATPVAAGHSAGTTGSGNNRGDAWVDAVGQRQVGHENDPHLGCNDIAVWGAALNDASGPFAIQGWPPSGSREVDFSGTWHYDTAAGGSQVIATVPVHTLLANATANGDAAVNSQGFHFKLDLEDPRTGGSVGDDKYKVFWVSCATTVRPGTSTPTPTPLSTATSTPTPTPTPSGGIGGLTATPTPVGGVQGLTTTTAPGATPSSGVAAAVSGSGAAIPFTGTALPLGFAGGLAAAGLALIGLSRRRRR